MPLNNSGRRDDQGPYSLDALKAIPIPALFTSDASIWKERLVTWFEAETGRTLYPMQIEMLLIETLSYAMGVLGQEGQMVIEQHLVATAGIEGLQRLGANRSTPRLSAAKAQVTLRFTLPAAQPTTTYIPMGTRASAGSDLYFHTTKAVSILAGQLSVDVTAAASDAGVAGNDLIAGQINALLDPIGGVSVANITTSSGGADSEDVELYRLRVANAFERVSTGGSYNWYRETAISVSAAIIDVAIIRPSPCLIDIYPLTLTGAAAIDLRNQVAATFNTRDALDIRFGDEVTIKPPIAVTAAPVITVRVRGAAATIQADAMAAANKVLTTWKQRLGAIIAPSEVEAAIRPLTGVIDAEVSSLGFAALAKNEYLVCTAVTVNIVVMP